MQVVQTVEQLRQARWAMTGRVGFVPTMGALHDGHLSLVELAKQQAEHVVVSIFVNPTQFGPGEDFQRYPRPIDDDLTRCASAGVDLVYNPGVDAMYPPDTPSVEINVPTLAKELEGALRPGHFAGVCRVCAKLFHMVEPDLAVFGQKDYQQLAVIRAMVADLAMPLAIVPGLTMREADGLAMSSRNRYLEGEDRQRALGLSEALHLARQHIADGESEVATIEQTMRGAMTRREVVVDYATLRHPQTLATVDRLGDGQQEEVVALVAGRVGSTRLIDNMVIPS